jgi:hypothetical protein
LSVDDNGCDIYLTVSVTPPLGIKTNRYNRNKMVFYECLISTKHTTRKLLVIHPVVFNVADP